MEENFSITNKTKGTLPRVPFSMIKERILGKKYSLSLVFIGKKKSHILNKTYRNKDKPTNVLSFPIDKETGEIFITPTMVGEFTIAFLFIHGCLHLKGMEHGSTMEKAEEKLRNEFGV